MATLDNAVWLTGPGGTAVSGSEVITEGSNSVTVTGTFTADAWDASQSGYEVSEFGAFGVSSPISANYEFSEPVENLTFDLQHVNASGTQYYDDQFTIYAYDENGDLLPSADVITAISGLTHHTVTVNGDGAVVIDSDGTGAVDLTISLPGSISQIEIVYEPGPEGTVTGGSGIGDLSFTIPDPVPCFTLGTLIATRQGEVAIEDLQAGDEVLTRDNGFQALRWIGQKTVPAQGRMAPVLIETGAIGNERPITVSQQHRMMITGWQAEVLFGEQEILVAAKHLTGLEGVRLMEGGEVTYVHILFDQHEIVFGNGILSESFLPGAEGQNALTAKTREEIFAIFPELRHNPAASGPPARRVLRSFEGQILTRALEKESADMTETAVS